MTTPTYQPAIRDSLRAEGIAPADERPEMYERDDFDPRHHATGRKETCGAPGCSRCHHELLNAPPSAKEMNMEQTWEDKFANGGADAKNVARATNILQALRANGVSQRRIDERGKSLLATLMAGKAPKASTTRTEREAQAAEVPAQQTLAVSPLADHEAELAEIEKRLAELEVLEERAVVLRRVIAAWKGEG